MSHKEKQGCRDDCSACNSRFLGALYRVRTMCAVVAVGAAIVGLIWNVTWMPVWIAAGAWIGLTAGFWAPCLPLMIRNWHLRKQVEKQRARIQELRRETLQLNILSEQRQAHLSALRAEKLELERMLAQRHLEQEAREARRLLEIACAAIEADRLEAAAWRMDYTAKQLEVKLSQADLFESLSAIEDNAQDRIIAAYQQGFDHGQQGIVIPIKQLRHLRVVEESA